jgi:hypothetical protein
VVYYLGILCRPGLAVTEDGGDVEGLEVLVVFPVSVGAVSATSCSLPRMLKQGVVLDRRYRTYNRDFRSSSKCIMDSGRPCLMTTMMTLEPFE